ncbi:hypothetical protein V8F06_014785 [Rhypophila decipiens]
MLLFTDGSKVDTVLVGLKSSLDDQSPVDQPCGLGPVSSLHIIRTIPVIIFFSRMSFFFPGFFSFAFPVSDFLFLFLTFCSYSWFSFPVSHFSFLFLFSFPVYHFFICLSLFSSISKFLLII